MSAGCAGLRALGVGVLLAGLPGAPASTQTPPPASGAAADAAPMTTVPEEYSYRPDGRRDPFVSLVGRGLDAAVVRRGDGLAGLSTAEIAVRGVLRSRGGYVAMVQGPDQKTHIVRANDRLADGTVKSITPQGLVILQEVNDPLSLVQQKEVRKGFPGSEGN